MKTQNKTHNKTLAYDPAHFIDSPEMAAAYLAASLEENGTQGFLKALGDVSRAKGMSKVAEQTQTGRQSLYVSLSENGKPQFETIIKALACFNLKIDVVPENRTTP